MVVHASKYLQLNLLKLRNKFAAEFLGRVAALLEQTLLENFDYFPLDVFFNNELDIFLDFIALVEHLIFI